MRERKHIVIDARVRPAAAGAGRYVTRLLEHLQTLDTFHRYTVLLSPGDDWRPHAQNFTALPCPYAQFSLNPLEQIGFGRQLRQLKPDLVHFTMTQQPLFYFGKIVTTTHDLTMFHFVRKGTTPAPVFWLKMGLYRFLLRWSHMKSAKIIAPTKFVATDIAAYQPSTKDKLVVTYEATEPPLKAKAERPPQIGENEPFIMYLGSAFPHKNLEKLIEAFDILQPKYPKLKLLLVGKKEIHYEELERKAKRHASAKNIIFTDFLPDEQTKWLYEHVQVYVFPSLSEGFGLPALEAMVHGAAVASSNATCLPEVYGPAAHYFNAQNPRDIAAKVKEILDDSDLQRTLIKNARRQIKKYSWQRMAEETLVVYKDALGEINDV